MNIDFAKIECATFLEHSQRDFADQMITGGAITVMNIEQWSTRAA